eukprot:2399380-Rhodomonas_salina.1
MIVNDSEAWHAGGAGGTGPPCVCVCVGQGSVITAAILATCHAVRVVAVRTEMMMMGSGADRGVGTGLEDDAIHD